MTSPGFAKRRSGRWFSECDDLLLCLLIPFLCLYCSVLYVESVCEDWEMPDLLSYGARMRREYDVSGVRDSVRWKEKEKSKREGEGNGSWKRSSRDVYLRARRQVLRTTGAVSRTLKAKWTLHRSGKGEKEQEIQHQHQHQENQKQPTTFFTLPPELRTLIYTLAFPPTTTTPNPVTATLDNLFPPPTISVRVTELHIALASNRLLAIPCVSPTPIEPWTWNCKSMLQHAIYRHRGGGGALGWRCGCMYRVRSTRSGCVRREEHVFDPLGRETGEGYSPAEKVQLGLGMGRQGVLAWMSVYKAAYGDGLDVLYAGGFAGGGSNGTWRFRFHSLAAVVLFAEMVPEEGLERVRDVYVDLRQPFTGEGGGSVPPTRGDDTVVWFPGVVRERCVGFCEGWPFAYHGHGREDGDGGGSAKARRWGRKRKAEEKYPTQWAAACAALSRMTGLRFLRVSLSSVRMAHTLTSGGPLGKPVRGEERVFAPLAEAVRRLREGKRGEMGGGEEKVVTDLNSYPRVEVDVDWEPVIRSKGEGVDDSGGKYEEDDGTQGLFTVQRMGQCDLERGEEGLCEACQLEFFSDQ